MDSGDIAVGQNATSRSGETGKTSKRWRQEHSTSVKMNRVGSLESQAQINPERMGSPVSAQLFGSGKGASPSNATQQTTDKQYPQQLPSPYACQHSLPFPQPSLPQGFLHNLKPRQSLEGQKWQFSGPLQPVASENLFPFHSGSFSRKKMSSLNPAFSQYSQKCIEQQSEDGYKKEHKPKKPGKYICPYCSRACAKPSVLKKHIRSHTGERPYPCVPCGFSFKTKSNLYKHRKSHAHAIKAGLVPFTESAVSKLDLESSFIDVEGEIHSDGEQSTDTDEEASLLIESSEKLSPVPQIPLDISSRSGFHTSVEESLGGPMKVPILIIPRSGVPLPCESSLHVGSDNLQNPLSTKPDDSHTVKQRLALRLSEKKGQDSEQSLNLLSPHSKGSTDSGYFSRSESAEQQISPPNTNVKSYEEIIFGKFYRINQRSVQPLTTANQDCCSVGRKSRMEPLPLVNPRLDIKMSEEQMSPNKEALIDPIDISIKKNRQVFNDSNSESQIITTSIKNESGLYPGSHLGDAPLFLESSDTNPLIRSNSMPTSSATNLNVPSSLRGSHSFDERMSGSDDVFYPETVGIPHQRMLIRQAAFELPSLQEGHSDSECHGRMGKNIMAVSTRLPFSEKGPGMREKLPGERHFYEGDCSGKYYRKWEDLGTLKQSFSGSKQSGEFCSESPTQFQAVSSTYGILFENRKRRIQKSVGDEEDTPSLCSGASGSPMTGDFDPKSQIQDGSRGGYALQSHDSSVHSHPERFEIYRPFLQSGSPATSLEEGSLATDPEKSAESLSRKGNVISVIQHTNSLSRPNSFERSESTDLVSCQQEKTYLTSESYESETVESPMSPERVPQAENAETVSNQPSSLQPFQPYMQPRLVRQHNIQVPEIRVTEEPDKPEREKEQPVKEQEKTAEEFQWPQRSETLSQLPAEKLPPKKKRLRLADLEHSSGESSFESIGTSLSRSPSQESNLSHSSSFSMSFEREDSVKHMTSSRQDELAKQSEFLTVPAGAHSLSVPGHQQQKEMRRCSSEQMPCPYPAETPEIRSKSFDYGNLSHASAGGAAIPASSPARERKKCFLVRQASFSGSPEISQADASMEQNIKQEQTEQGHAGLQSSQTAWSHSSIAVLSDDSGKQMTGSCLSRNTSLSPFSHPSLPQAPYVPSKYSTEQQHLLALQEKVPFFPLHNALLQFPYPSVCMVRLPSQPLWPSEMSKSPFPHHFIQQLQKSYSKQPFPVESHPGCHLEYAQEHLQQKPDYVYSKEQPYQRYSGTSGQYSKNALAIYQPDCSIKSTDTSSEQQLRVNIEPVQSVSGTVVPVRIQTHVPSYGSVMYTSISQILAQSSSPAIVICKVDDTLSQRTLATSSSMHEIGFNIAQVLNQRRGLEKYPLWKVPQTLSLSLDSSIPLCLTSSSDTASTLGGNKRMLSPASSLEIFVETKQQKRVKDEKMYGQIVEELSAVDLTNSDIKKSFPRPQKPQLVRQSCTTEPKESVLSSLPSSPLSSSSSSQDLPVTKMSPTEPSPLNREKLSSFDSASPGQKSSGTSEGRESPEELDVDETSSEMSLSPQRSLVSSGESQMEEQSVPQKLPFGMLVQMASQPSGKAVTSAILLTGLADIQQILQFPSLRTTTTVSWCFLNYTKPSFIQQATLKSSVYASWCISSCNPNPSGLSTKITLALLRSKQKNSTEIYTLSPMHRPGTGKLTSSSAWKQFAQMKQEPFFVFDSKFEKKVAGNVIKERIKGDNHCDKDIVVKQTEPMRIKIFEGGYKSNEDYVYVRGRGRGKYICEECGIRCKKPSMLKKHIRTHTDVRPYICKLCNFAFKTKGNLTKHMKSKAHMKKCLELGVSMSSVDDAEAEETENMEDSHQEMEKNNMSGPSTEHQFSDAEESDGEDGEDNDEDDDDDDDFDDALGDSTPKTRSRSTSPQPPRNSSLSVNVSMAPYGGSHESSLGHSSLINYLGTLPSIQVSHLLTTSDDSQMTEYQRFFQNKSTDSEPDKDRLDIPSCMDEDYMISLESYSSPRDLSSFSRQSSPGYDSSPYRDSSPNRYLMPKGDLSPRSHLSPRREISPIRHFSPRKETVLRRELSPRRDASPRRHLSPRRPVSPGKDVSSRRDLSPRRERRYMASIRASSPRRGLYHNPSLPMGQYIHSESVPMGHMSSRSGLLQAPYLNLPGEEGSLEHHIPNLFPEGPTDYVFSHLPLHSQQQLRAPVPMMPIGGIQIVHSLPAALSGFHPPSIWSLPKEGSTEKKWESVIPSKHPEKRPCPHTLPSELLPRKESTLKEGVVEREQEENIQTCTKAIASLCIATEELLHGSEQFLREPEPFQKPLDGAHFSMQHFSGSEPGQTCASATNPDLHSGEKDLLGTSQPTVVSHSTFYSKSSADVRPLRCLSRKESPSNTQERKEPLSEKSKPQ